jgi:hypothetical protein
LLASAYCATSHHATFPHPEAAEQALRRLIAQAQELAASLAPDDPRITGRRAGRGVTQSPLGMRDFGVGWWHTAGMTEAAPASESTQKEPPPKKGETRVVDGELQEFDGSAWVKFQYLPQAGTGGDGKPIVIYKFFTDYEVDG